MLLRSRLALVAFLATVVPTVRHAHAQPTPPTDVPPITVTWRAPEGCSSRDEVLARVHALLTPGPSDPARAVDAQAEVTPQGDGFSLSLVLTDAGGKHGARRISGSTCATLRDAAALVIALAFDPARVRVDAPPDAPPAPPSTPEPPAPAPAPAAPPPVRQPPSPERPSPAAPRPRGEPPPARLGAGLAVFADIGTMPSPAPALAAELALAIDAWRIAPYFLVFPSSRTGDPATTEESAGGATFSLLGGGIRGCRQALPFAARPEPAAGDPTLLGCVSVELGDLRADGFGVSRPSETRSLWAAAGADARFEIFVATPLFLEARAGISVPLNPLSFVIERPGDDALLHTPSPVGGRFGGGIGALF